MEAGGIRVWPTEEAMEDALAASPAQAVVLGESDTTWAELVRQVTGREPPEPVTARLRLRAAVERAGFVATRGFLAAAARFVAEAERARLPVDALEGGLFDVYGSVGRPGGLRVPSGPLEIMPRLDWEPADVELLVELARHVPVRVHLPWASGRPAIYGGLEAILSAFERLGAHADLDLILEDPAEGARAARALVSAIYYGTAAAPPKRGAAGVSVLAAPHPFAELRGVAARIRRLVDGGAAPESIVVAMRAPEGAGLLAGELARVGLLLDDRPGSPLASAPPVRLALSLFTLGEGREEVVGVLGSGYVRTGAPAFAVARTARSLGLRRFDADGLARLHRAPDGEPLAAAVRALLDSVGKLPELAPLGEHAAALSRVLAELGVLEAARGGSAPGDARVERAIARDQLAAATFEALLGRVGFAARQAGFVRPLTRAEAAAVLADVAGEISVGVRGVRGGAVRLLGLGELASRRFDHVIIPGLVDGRAPLAGLDDGIYGERERRAMNQALGRWALPSHRFAEGGPLPAERTPYETLLLVSALAAARKSVLLSYAESVDDRPVARSPFVDEVVRAAPWIDVARAPLTPLAPLADAVAPADVLARAALETWAAPAMRTPPRPSDPTGPSWLGALSSHWNARVGRVSALAEIERRRWGFFAGDEPISEWVGAVEPARSSELGGPRAPLPARQLEILANCPWAFFAARLLGTEAAPEASDAPTPMRVGRIAHRCLEVFYKRGGRDRAALDAACAEVFAEEEAEGPSGDRRLWALGREKLADDLWRLVETEVPWGGKPIELELAFGNHAALPALEIGGVHVSGRIDRLDRTADGHVVVDYKLGGKYSLAAKLREAGNTQLQLPLYAAAVRAAKGGKVDAGFVSIKDASARTLGSARAAELIDEVLPARMAELGAHLREGRFEVRPEDCRGCDFRTVCRVVHLNEDEDRP